MFKKFLPPGKTWADSNGLDKAYAIMGGLLMCAFCVLFLPVLYLAKKK